MSRVPVGKVLLRNVIRHTGAHNKVRPGPVGGSCRPRRPIVPPLSRGCGAVGGAGSGAGETSEL